MIAPDLTAIPAFLTGLDRWVLWRTETRNGKRTKVPKTIANTNALTTKPDTWSSFTAVESVLRRNPTLFDGVGIVLGDLGDGQHLGGVDLDCCLVDGVLAEWAKPFVANAPTYTEVSPSGNGLKLFLRIGASDAAQARAAFGIGTPARSVPPISGASSQFWSGRDGSAQCGKIACAHGSEARA